MSPSVGRMHLTIDMARYLNLPPRVRVEFDGWLESETLLNRHVVELTLGEGWVTIRREDLNAQGRPYLDENHDIVFITERVRVGSLPPSEVFDGSKDEQR